MTRLIDADAIQYEQILEPMGNGMYCHVKHVYESDIDAQPTVDAIPIGWIERFLAEREIDKWADEPQSEYWLRIDQEINDIESMVTHWMNTEGREE